MKEDKLKVLILGDNVNAPYHPIAPVEGYLKEALEKDFDLTITEDREVLNADTLSNYDLLLSYVDTWGQRLPSKQLGAFLAYVAQGGNLFVLHSGIAYQTDREFAQLVQAKFVGHPPYQELSFRATGVEHPITEGIEPFKMEEELYTFEFEKSFDGTVLLECTNGELTQPALWFHAYGAGKVVYLAPGHSKESFMNSSCLELVKRCALWAAGRL